jgi:L-threonylcarbamoyladenylate synthase
VARLEVPRWRPGDAVGPLAAHLAAGGVVAIPTESSYGLAAVPTHAGGVEAVYRVKRRERGKPLPVVIAGVEQLPGLGIAADLPILTRLSAFWPGALTVVVPLAGDPPVPAAAGSGCLAVRVPGHALLRELLASLGHGLTATSLNVSGEPPILAPGEAIRLLRSTPGVAAMVVDGGELAGGPPSTLVEAVAPEDPQDAAPPAVRVLRAGAFPIELLRSRVRIVPSAHIASGGTEG